MARVTLVVNSHDEGSETFLHTLAEQLSSLGHDVTVHALLDGRTTMVTGAEFDTGGDLARSAAMPPVRSPRFLPAAGRFVASNAPSAATVVRRGVRRFGRGARAARAAALAAPIVATGPDVVHLAFSGIGVALVDAVELLVPGTRVVVSCRGTGELVTPVIDESVRPALRRVLERADAIHAVADVVADAAIRWGADPDSVSVIRPAVRGPVGTERPRPAIAGPVRLVTVARLHWVKAVDVQLSALAMLRDRNRDVTLTIVGDGPDRSALEFRARALGIADRVDFLGSCPSDAVREVLGRSDVFLLSSLSEGTANSVLEAMSVGMPVVSSSAGGMAEVLTDGVDAMVVPPGDAGSVAGAVERMIDQPDLAAAMGDAGRRTVQGEFTVDHQREAFGDFYRRLLEPTGGAQR